MKYWIYILLIGLLIPQGLFGQEAPPVIHDVSPDTGSVGNTVTLTGENFATTASNNIVRFGATIGDIISLSSTELSVAIPAGADPFGPISLTKLTNFTTAFSTPFQITFQDGVIYRDTYINTTVTSGSDLQAGAAGDFDEDGNVDLASVSSSSNAIYLYFGNGAGGFDSQIQLDTDSGPQDVIAVDYNDDGHLDLVTANGTAGTISIIPGNGDGTFGARTDFSVAQAELNAEPLSVNRGDFNNDGYTDLTVANYETDSVKVLLNFGGGDFSEIRAFDAIGNPYEVIVADFDDDGNDDIGVATDDISGTLILFGDGTGDFPESRAMASSSNDVTYGDYNGDGLLDLAACIGSTDRVYVFLNNGDRSFSYENSFATSTDPRDLASGDFDGDGILDIVTANVDGNDLSVLVGDGSGNFPDSTNFTVGNFPRDVVPADFNNDGKTDLAVPNQNSSNISILQYEDPFVKIDSVRDIQQDSMTVYAEALDKGVTYDERGVAWSTSPSPTISDSSKASGSGLGTYSVTLSELVPNTVYYVRPYVHNIDGYFYGNEVRVTTLPDVTTTQPAGIGPTYAETGGVINDTVNGNGTINDRGVAWDTLATPAINDNRTFNGSGTGSFTSLIKGLESNTTYYVRAFAVNESGISYGDEYAFTTEEFTYEKITDFIQWKKMDSADFSGSFGLAEQIDMAGTLAIVSENGANTAYILNRDSGGTDNWGKVAHLFSDTVNTSNFPTGVAIDQDVAVLGSSNNDGQATNNGAVYLVQKNDSTGAWDEIKQVQPPDSDSDLFFGKTVDISENTMAVGADSMVYIYKRDLGGTNNWGFLKKITSPNTDDRYFGNALALNGHKLVVGSPQYFDGRGAAYVFHQNQGGTDNWGFVKNLTPESVTFGDFFGQSVDEHADQVIVGATSLGSSSGVGEVYIFEKDLGGTNNWGLKANLNGDGIDDAYGAQVAIENDVALVGAYRNKITEDYRGAVFVLAKNNSSTWVTSQKLTPDAGNPFYNFGRSLSMAGNSAFFRSRTDIEGEDELYIFRDKAQEPSAFTLSSDTVRENKPAGSLVGEFEADVDDPSINYSLVDGTGSEGNEYFLIEGNQLLTDSIFDFEAKNTYSIRVNASNGDRFDLDSIFKIHIKNVNEPPEVNNPIENQSGVVGDSMVINIPDDLFIDPEGDSIAIDVNIPEGSFLAYYQNDNQISGVPAESDTGTTTIEIIGTDEGDASDTTSFDVDIRLKAQVTLYPAQPAICRGEALTLFTEISNSPGTPSYSWYLNDEPISGATSDTLELGKVTDGDVVQVKVDITGPDGEKVTTVTDEVAITVHPNPEASISTNGFFVTASSGTKYVWYLNNEKLPDTTRSIIAKREGEYQVEVFNEYGCSTLSEPKYMYVTSIDDPKGKDLLVYPNPVNDHLKVKLQGGEITGAGSLSIYDEQGQQMLRKRMDQKSLSIDVSHWEPGSYFLLISNGEEVFKRKILKY